MVGRSTVRAASATAHTVPPEASIQYRRVPAPERWGASTRTSAAAVTTAARADAVSEPAIASTPARGGQLGAPVTRRERPSERDIVI